MKIDRLPLASASVTFPVHEAKVGNGSLFFLRTSEPHDSKKQQPDREQSSVRSPTLKEGYLRGKHRKKLGRQQPNPPETL